MPRWIAEIVGFWTRQSSPGRFPLLSSMLGIGLAGSPALALANPVLKPDRERTEFQVNTYTTGAQEHPSASRASSDGGYVVVWESQGQDGDDDGIFFKRYDASGGILTPESPVNTYTTGAQQNPAVAHNDSGGFVVVWNGGGGGDTDGIHGRMWQTGWTNGEFSVNTHTTGTQKNPSISWEGYDFVAVWQSDAQDGDGDGIFARRFYYDQTPLDSTDFQVNSYTTGTQENPAVAVSYRSTPDLFDFVVVWNGAGEGGDADGIHGRAWTYPAGFGSEFQINIYTTGVQANPSVSQESLGKYVVVWDSNLQDGNAKGVFGRVLEWNGTTLQPSGAEFQVNTYTNSDQMLPSVASYGAADYSVVWQSVGQVHFADVFGQSFWEDHSINSEFQVNTYTNDDQRAPSVSPASRWGFVAVWESQGQDGDARGIYGQCYQLVRQAQVPGLGSWGLAFLAALLLASPALARRWRDR